MNRKATFWISVLLFAVATGVIFFKGDQQDRGFFSPELRKIKADLVLYGVRYRRDARGKPSQWIVDARLARFYEKRNEVEFEDVTIVLRPDDESPVKVRARTGKYEIREGTVSVEGNVTVTGVKDYVLHSERLLYRPGERASIEAPGDVMLVGKSGNELVGRNMVYLLGEHKLLLYSPRAIIKEDDVQT